VEINAEQVITRLSRQISELAVRLAVVETQLEAYQRNEVDRMAAQEAQDADS